MTKDSLDAFDPLAGRLAGVSGSGALGISKLLLARTYIGRRIDKPKIHGSF
jgi:hypothetical protein